MKTTNNLGLKKIELSDSPPDITIQDTNWDLIDKHLYSAVNYQKAGGTGTTITLNEVTLTDGFSKTFIVTTANAGAATTINGKSLYKPGGILAPNLIAGKAVTVWYSSTGDCFFIKASAEGDAVAANVLAGKKYSNDNDTGITGTMANNGAVTLTPGTADQFITAGYHNGSGKVVGDADLISANIKAGVDIFGVSGKATVVDTADANAVAGNMLSGKTGYVNGAKVTGTIASKAAATITPGKTDQIIAAGQFLSGAQTIKGDANLVAANIAKGKAIFNVDGTLDNRLINFPLSIQDAEPTPIRAGHIWVKSDTLASQITKVKILEAINAGETDGTLMLVVGDLYYHSFSFSNTIDLINGDSKQISIADTVASSSSWEIINKTGNSVASLKINNPFIYSKVGGVIDVETSYIWNGTVWLPIFNKGTYFMHYTSGGGKIYNYNSSNEFTSIGTGTGSVYRYHKGQGNYLVSGSNVYVMQGQFPVKITTLPTSVTYASKVYKPMIQRSMKPTYYEFADNGQTLYMLMYNWSSGYNEIWSVFKFTLVDGVFQFVDVIMPIQNIGGTSEYDSGYIKMNPSRTVMIIYVANGIIKVLFNNGDSWVAGKFDGTSSPTYNYLSALFDWSSDTRFMGYSTNTSSSPYFQVISYTIDYINMNIISASAYSSYTTLAESTVAWMNVGEGLFIARTKPTSGTSWNIFDFNATNIIKTLSASTLITYTSDYLDYSAFNSDGRLCAITRRYSSGSTYYATTMIYTVSYIGNTVTLIKITELDYVSNSSLLYSYPVVFVS
ncbi:MAG: hypothetical protein K0R00_3359 [Herbinix sp.]|nr:hypothetical protein [Herbinix sp.]